MNDLTPIKAAPSGYRIEQALSTWHAARARLLREDESLAQDEAALAELLGPEVGDVDDVLSRVLRAAAHAKSMADAAADRIEDMKARQDRYKRRNDAMRATAFAIMDALGRNKIELPDMTVSIRAGQVGVTITDEAALPEIYIREVTTRSPAKDLLLAALKQQAAIRAEILAEALTTGEILDETKLPAGIPGAILSNGMPSLNVRVK